MRTSKLLSKKKIELFLITTNLQFQHHIVLPLPFLCESLFLPLPSVGFAVGVTDIAVDLFFFCCTH